MAAMVAVFAILPLLATMTREILERITFIRRGGEEELQVTINGMDFVVEGRTTFVRIQEPKPLLMGLRCGGQMKGMGWKDVDIAKYDLPPGQALSRAVDDYDGYRISQYQEVDERTPEPTETGWIGVDPKRDLPDDET